MTRGGLVLPGVTQVACPVCRAVPGRVCTNRRGYIPDGGFHRQRRALWLAQERAEARRRTTTGLRAGADLPGR